MVKKTGSGNTRPSGRVKELSDKSQQGRGAKELLENKTLNQALNAMREEAFAFIEASGSHEKDKREELYHYIRSINEFKKRLKIYINKGDGAAIELDKLLKGD